MAFYQCPLCHKQIDRELILFLDHTNQHVIDRIREKHPEWVEADGACKPCVTYYQMELSGQLSEMNIGPSGRRFRLILGIVMLVISLGLVFALAPDRSNRIWRISVFVPVFLAFLNLIEAKEKTCVLLSELSLQNFDQGSKKIGNLDSVGNLKMKGRKIIAQSALFALLVSVLFLFYP